MFLEEVYRDYKGTPVLEQASCFGCFVGNPKP